MELSLNKLPWYGQVGLFVVIALAMAGAFYYLYAMPAQAEMQGRRLELASLRADITKGSTVANQLNQFKAQVAELQARLESLRAVLPEEKDVADLLRRIQTLATQSNLAIRGFKPSPSVTKQLHAEWPITLQLDGTYQNLGLFFDRVSKFSRIINISNLDIKAKTPPQPNSTITAECVATTFVLLDSKALAAAAAATAKAAAARGAAPPAAAK
jgi:type IV pilus assembly protein PilO